LGGVGQNRRPIEGPIQPTEVKPLRQKEDSGKKGIRKNEVVIAQKTVKKETTKPRKKEWGGVPIIEKTDKPQKKQEMRPAEAHAVREPPSTPARTLRRRQDWVWRIIPSGQKKKNHEGSGSSSCSRSQIQSGVRFREGTRRGTLSLKNRSVEAEKKREMFKSFAKVFVCKQNYQQRKSESAQGGL